MDLLQALLADGATNGLVSRALRCVGRTTAIIRVFDR